MCRVEEGLSKDGSSVVRETMDQMTARIGGDGGAIAIDTKGPSISFYPDFIMILSKFNPDFTWIKLNKIGI